MANTPVTHEQHLLTVGKLEHNAAAAEGIMFGAFTLIGGLKPNISRAIFYALDSFPGKRGLLRRVAEEQKLDATETELMEKIISGAEVANNQRKQVAHGMMSFATVRIYSPKNQPQPKIPSKEWHNDLLQKSQAAGLAAKAAFEALCQKRGVPPTIDFE
jgi:hypothetical protein